MPNFTEDEQELLDAVDACFNESVEEYLQKVDSLDVLKLAYHKISVILKNNEPGTKRRGASSSLLNAFEELKQIKEMIDERLKELRN